MDRRETTTGMKGLESVLQKTASVWMPFDQTCDEESGDADFDSFKTAPGDAHRGTRIGGDVHDTVAISDGHTGSTDVDIFRRSAVCLEVDIPADMDCTVV